MSVKFYHYVCLLALTSIARMASAGPVASSTSSSRNLFAADLFRTLASKQSEKNVVFSPASIQSCLTLAYMGAEGKTAEEMHKGLRLVGGDKQEISKNYADFLKTVLKQVPDDGPQLKMANGVFVNNAVQVAPEFDKVAREHFQSRTESINFAESEKAVKTINDWVEKETNNKIKNLMEPGSVDGGTSTVLVNAIYFKGRWQNPFSESSTTSAKFYTSSNKEVWVPTMFVDDKFRYVDLPDLDAAALEMPYENSDISMLIVLPNKRDGLQNLESKLAGLDFNDITSKMTKRSIDLFLPKFRIEFDVDLKEPLQELGMPQIFSESANFTGMFVSPVPQKISDVRHKAFLDVNEAGSEAAAATYVKIVPTSLILGQISFRVDHPFVFAIRNSEAVYFVGHVVDF